ncbi:flagellar basal body P-ring formation chaperone FlgA, partial [Longimicrobium sp.]|uniref:flagellar basal body P-ring formation chaperone FlgA n=1 Tax=Longimicrobium sp. TaxID=2029185 RepID=UPI002E30A931
MSVVLRLLARMAGVSGALAATPGHAQPATRASWAPPAAVDQAVRDTIAARWGVRPADVRLSWSPPGGDLALVAGAPRLAGGAADGWWTASLPAAGNRRVLARVRAGVDTAAATAARDLPRGIALEAEDIASTTALRWGPPRARTAPVRAGWVTRRVLAAGEPLEEPGVVPPALVSARDTVAVQVTRGAARVELRGEAMESGALGERVRVRLGPGWQLEGTVTG